MRVLVFNCGSSSLKFEFLEVDAAGALLKRLARGTYEEIGPHAHAKLSDADGRKFDAPAAVANHAEAALRAIEWLRAGAGTLQLDAIAHRIVHGGDRVSEPAIVDDSVVG